VTPPPARGDNVPCFGRVEIPTLSNRLSPAALRLMPQLFPLLTIMFELTSAPG
jgi:hypothetical protein